MTLCRSVADTEAAALADAAEDPPLSQDTADLVAAILTSREPEASDEVA